MRTQKTFLAIALAASLGALTAPAMANVYFPPVLSPVTIDANVPDIGRCVLNRTRIKSNLLPKKPSYYKKVHYEWRPRQK